MYSKLKKHVIGRHVPLYQKGGGGVLEYVLVKMDKRRFLENRTDKVTIYNQNLIAYIKAVHNCSLIFHFEVPIFLSNYIAHHSSSLSHSCILPHFEGSPCLNL